MFLTQGQFRLTIMRLRRRHRSLRPVVAHVGRAYIVWNLEAVGRAAGDSESPFRRNTNSQKQQMLLLCVSFSVVQFSFRHAPACGNTCMDDVALAPKKSCVHSCVSGVVGWLVGWSWCGSESCHSFVCVCRCWPSCRAHAHAHAQIFGRRGLGGAVGFGLVAGVLAVCVRSCFACAFTLWHVMCDVARVSGVGLQCSHCSVLLSRAAGVACYYVWGRG